MPSNYNSLRLIKPLLLILVLASISCSNKTKQNEHNTIQTRDIAPIPKEKKATVDTLQISQSENENNRNIKFWGEWIGTDNSGTKASLILDKSNHATFVINNQVVGDMVNEVASNCRTQKSIWLMNKN
jgi:hypothetical protein